LGSGGGGSKIPRYFLTSLFFRRRVWEMDIVLFVAQYTNTDCGMVAVSGIRPKANILRNCREQNRTQHGEVQKSKADYCQ
jgi:hypothetical protein